VFKFFINTKDTKYGTKEHEGQKYKTKLKQLNLPEYSFTIRGKEGEEMILDLLRRRFVKLTSEEWVRQNFIRYLNDRGKYPLGLMGIEMEFGHNKLKKRTDILVHNRLGEPVMIVECKAPEVFLVEEVFEQIATYNLKFKVPYLVVTNGMRHFACKFRNDFKSWDYLLVIPLYEELVS
jgi:Type I restriction enzyme R protein N terminus (HSDR_N)